MATEIGTATDHFDLYNKLYNFLTANTELVAANQQWTEVWANAATTHPVTATDAASEFMLKGPGLAGNDSIYVSFSLRNDTTNDIQGMWIRGADAPLDSATRYGDHINDSGAVWTPMFANSMPYWFVANGRRFVAVWKCSTVYEACSAGLFLPFSTPAGYPYPVYVGGSSESEVRYSEDSYRHTHFIDPGPRDAASDGGNSSSTGGRSLIARMPGGSWQRFGNNRYSSSYDAATTYPYAGPDYTGENFLEQTRPLLGGGYLLTPITLIVDRTEAKGTLGALDGVYHVPGIGNATENILSIGGVDHLVVQNVYRTDYEGFWALALQ